MAFLEQSQIKFVLDVIEEHLKQNGITINRRNANYLFITETVYPCISLTPDCDANPYYTRGMTNFTLYQKAKAPFNHQDPDGVHGLLDMQYDLSDPESLNQLVIDLKQNLKKCSTSPESD